MNAPANTYARAAKLAPDAGHVLNVYAIWLCQQDKAAEADALFARAVKDPFFKAKETAYFNAGKCARRSGRPTRPRSTSARAWKSRPENKLLLVQMAEVQLRAATT